MFTKLEVYICCNCCSQCSLMHCTCFKSTYLMQLRNKTRCIWRVCGCPKLTAYNQLQQAQAD